MSLLSICIVNWNTKEFLRETLASIEQFPANISQEIIVVDNASTDGSALMVREEFPAVKLISNTSNLGYAEGNNQALAMAQGSYLLLLNPDVQLKDGTLDSAIAECDTLPEFGALGVKQIGADGETQLSVRSFPDPMGVFYELVGISKIFPKSKTFASYRMTWFGYNSAIEVDQPMATFLLTTRSVYEIVGGMDPQFPIFFNDVDWCFRIKQAGFKIFFTNKAEIIHYGGASTRKANRSRMASESKTSLLRFYDKHYYGKIPRMTYQTVRLAIKLSLTMQRLRTITK